MPANSPGGVSLDLEIDAALMDRLTRFASERGITTEALLIQSVEFFLDSYPPYEAGAHDDAQ